MLQLNKIIFAFLLAGTLPGADNIKVVFVSFCGCFACCGSKKINFVFFSAGTLPAANKGFICVSFSGSFACSG